MPEPPIAELVRVAIERAGPGPACLDLPAAWPSSAASVGEVVRACGLMPVVCSGERPAHREGALRHRHVALIVASHGGGLAAAGWVKWLARASPRGHVVLRFTDQVPGRTPRRRANRWRARGDPAVAEADDRRLVRLVAAGEWERAEAWLAALRAEAWLTGRQCREATVRAWVWLRLRQRRVEEAVHAACQTGDASLRAALLASVHQGAGGSGRADEAARAGRHSGRLAAECIGGANGVDTMYLLTAIPALLQHLAEADDESSALRGAAAWGRERAGASGVAFIGAEDGRVAASDGWSGHGPPAQDRLLAIRPGAIGRHQRDADLLVTAPVRHAGVDVGAVLVAGPVERSETLAEAAGTLALLCASALRLRLDQMALHRHGRTLVPEIIGDSPACCAMRDAIARAAATPFAALVEGESGTGKELVARALHRLSPRRDRRFVAVNCAALSDELFEAELFGHARGAFTGAVAPREGLFEDAHGGTLFLDEVAELSPRAQAKLLRALQEREVRRVGENHPRAVDVRVVAATNRSLREACARGQFREDLLFRLAVIRLRLAPLRERTEDIAPIAAAFWIKVMREVGKRAVMGADAVARLAAHQWPGNVRELQNVVAGLSVLAPVRGRVLARHVDMVLATGGLARHAPPMSLESARLVCERQTVTAALARHAGRRTAAARELGLTRQGLAKIMRRLHIDDSIVEGVA